MRIFYVLPVQRKPSNRNDLLHNQFEFDEEDFDFQFRGLFYEDDLPFGHEDRMQLYLFGVHDNDILKRDLYTPGFRVCRKAAKGRFDYQIESVLQFGSRKTVNGTHGHFVHFNRVEIRARYDILRENLRLEVGYARLFAGDFIDDVTNGGDSDYFYTQVLLGF